MAFDLIAVATAVATAAAAAGVAETTRRLFHRRPSNETGAGTVSFGDVRAGGDVTQSGRDTTIHRGRSQ